MHCEFCDISFGDLAEARRHMLTVAHIREKRNNELSSSKLVERMRQATVRPKDLAELTKLLNIHSSQDAIALDKLAFFKIHTVTQSKVVRELIRVLYQEITEYYVKALPSELRQPTVKAYEKQKATP